MDSDGNQINAHEGWILQIEDTYLWYGTSHKTLTADPATGSSDWLSGSINLFVSRDLASWRRKPAVFSAAGITASTAPAAVAASRRLRAAVKGAGPYRIERPKVLYNSGHRYYVLLFHLDSIDMGLAQLGWAVSPSPYGPFVFQAASQPDGLGSLDLSVAAAGDSADAYLVRSVPGGSLAISKLSPDYLGTQGVCGSLHQHQHQQQPHPAAAAAAAHAAATGMASEDMQGAAAAAGVQGSRVGGTAPSLFAFNGRWYLLVSRGSGWSPGPLQLFVSNGSDPCGASWSPIKHAAAGPGSGSGFDSSPAFALPYRFGGPGRDGAADGCSQSSCLPIYFGDRWNQQGPGSVGNASYVWLPFVPAAGSADPSALQLLNPGGPWKISDYRQPAPSL
uniref:Glycosyl hydrolase family 32 N-terminal domain-containing protein n=1 Tax=Tetradesmus obliquus TaxID=3088 RepID=A0A383VWQ5_TETOB|eukprot:jgi/Sobl393_1/3130/SZX69194.1